MRLGITVWNNRIAPVFDVAAHLRLLAVSGGRATAQEDVPFDAELALLRVNHLVALGVDTLICGAVSASIERASVARGIALFSFVTGDADKIVDTYSRGAFPAREWLMPGCRRMRMRGGGGPGDGGRSGGGGKGGGGSGRRRRRAVE